MKFRDTADAKANMPLKVRKIGDIQQPALLDGLEAIGIQPGQESARALSMTASTLVRVMASAPVLPTIPLDTASPRWKEPKTVLFQVDVTAASNLPR